MTVHREKTCACGHAASFHMKGEKKRGRCLYGHDRNQFGTTVAPCTCLAFHRRASPAAYSTEISAAAPAIASALSSQEPEVLRAIDDIIAGFQRLRRALPVARPFVGTPYLGEAIREVHTRPRAECATPLEHGSRPPIAPKTTRPRATPVDGEVKLPRGAQNMLDILASHGELTKIQLGTLNGTPAKKSTFRTYFGLLKQHGFVADGDVVELLAAGRKRARAVQVQTREDILAKWATKLAAGARRILDVVVDRERVTRDQIGKETGIDPHGSTFRTYLGKLKSNQLVDEEGGFVTMGPALASAR